MNKRKREALWMAAMLFTNFIVFISRGERMDFISFATGVAVASCVMSIFNLPGED